MLEIGSVVDGKYKILSEIGHGGMSVVYLAINERANKTWAIKELRKDGTVDFSTVRQGLVVETEILKKLSHPHLPSIIDVIDQDDSFLIVMDYIEGRSLDSLLRHGGAQPPDKVIEWAKQLCDVLGYLHSRRPPIIYRDMKPGNVMLKPDGNVMLLDFGTAREYKDKSVADTTCLGTRGYAAPEQFGGRGQSDARTDIYCLGATMYHLLTGHSPAEPPYEIKPLGYWNVNFIGSGLEKLVARCTRQNPAERYQSCAELMYALEHVHDEDDANRRRRSRIWGCFVASLAVTVLGVAGMVIFALAGNAVVKESYDRYLAQARAMGGGSAAAVDSCRAAISLQPSRPEAYDAMLDAVDGDLLFTGEESAELVSCFLDTDGVRTNLERLADSDPEACDALVYRLANDYYFFYDGSDGRTKAVQWYERVLDSETLDVRQVELANGLYAISSYYPSLTADKSVFSVGEHSNTWLTFWQQMAAITDGDLAFGAGGTRYAAALYQELADQVLVNAANFKAYGVSYAEIEFQLDKAEQGLAALTPESVAVQQQIAEALRCVSMARRQADAVFSAMDTGTGG